MWLCRPPGLQVSTADTRQSIIIIDYCTIDRLLCDRPIAAQSTDRCTIGGSVECAAHSADSAAQSPDRASRLSAHNKDTNRMVPCQAHDPAGQFRLQQQQQAAAAIVRLSLSLWCPVFDMCPAGYSLARRPRVKCGLRTCGPDLRTGNRVKCCC